MPQLFNIIIEYQNDFPQFKDNSTTDLCTMIEHKVNKSLVLSYVTTSSISIIPDPLMDTSLTVMEDFGNERSCEVVCPFF